MTAHDWAQIKVKKGAPRPSGYASILAQLPWGDLEVGMYFEVPVSNDDGAPRYFQNKALKYGQKHHTIEGTKIVTRKLNETTIAIYRVPA